MQVVRRKDDHLKILKAGYVPQGGLGDFDTAIYEEVTLDSLPEGFSLETPQYDS